MTGFSLSLRSNAYREVFHPEYIPKNKVLNIQGLLIYLK